jgi:hypothetical protein
MADFLVLLLVLGFFGLCVAFVQGCDRIIGPDDDADLDAPAAPAGDDAESLVTT